MIIVAGIFYLTSAGNPQRIETAKKALIYAIAGIAIGLAATAIVNIIKNVIGAT
jgi:NAD/NADP transhydrogenase beta subunit